MSVIQQTETTVVNCVFADSNDSECQVLIVGQGKRVYMSLWESDKSWCIEKQTDVWFVFIRTSYEQRYDP